MSLFFFSDLAISGGKGSKRLGTVAEAVFFVRCQFGGGLRVAVRDEERIVAEAAVAARGVGDVSVPQPFCDERQRVVGVAQVNDEAGVVSAAVAVIGKGGEKLKKISTEARLDMEKLFDCKVFLKVWVKVKSGWADDVRFLNELGL